MTQVSLCAFAAATALLAPLHIVASPSFCLTLAVAAALAPSIAAHASPLFVFYALEVDMESYQGNPRFWDLVVPALGLLPPRVAEALFNASALLLPNALLKCLLVLRLSSFPDPVACFV